MPLLLPLLTSSVWTGSVPIDTRIAILVIPRVWHHIDSHYKVLIINFIISVLNIHSVYSDRFFCKALGGQNKRFENLMNMFQTKKLDLNRFILKADAQIQIRLFQGLHLTFCFFQRTRSCSLYKIFPTLKMQECLLIVGFYFLKVNLKAAGLVWGYWRCFASHLKCSFTPERIEWNVPRFNPPR